MRSWGYKPLGAGESPVWHQLQRWPAPIPEILRSLTTFSGQAIKKIVAVIMIFSVVCAGLLFASSSTATTATFSSTSLLFESSVPTDVPVVGIYSGDLRPQIHYSPPQHFMNDPNGCFRDRDGLWHLYYQYNPVKDVAGNQHWGHATSQDLYHWENQKIAIFPSNHHEQIFSGSAVVDSENTSGFFPDQNNGVVAIYTLNLVKGDGLQVQEIAYSRDGGYSFTKYDRNPVITSTSNQFRDPYVIRYGNTWVMVVAYSQAFTIGIYTSPDLKDWTHASNFSHHGLLGLQYECPNLVPMPVAGSEETMYVLTISINPGAPLGGSIMQYFPGFFNGTHFTAVDGAARIADFGKDNYAGQFFHGLSESEDPVFIAWASNWQYGQQVPTGEKEGWRSAMSLPRRTHLANVTRTGWDLISAPYDLTPIYDTQLASNPNIGNGSIKVDYSSIGSGAIYFKCQVSNIPSAAYAAGTLDFAFSSSSTKESLTGGFFFGGDTPFFLSRQKIQGFSQNRFFTDKVSAANPINDQGIFTLEGVIDRSIFEVFLDGGRNSATMTFYPDGVLNTLEIMARGINETMVVGVEVWGLKSAWLAMEGADGVVYGNLTGGGMAGNLTQGVKRGLTKLGELGV